MRKLVVGTFMTLDGVMQAPGGPDEDRDGGFEHGGWSVGYWDELMGRVADESHQGEFVLGRRSYEILGGHWPKLGEDDPMAAKLNRARKHVASRTLRPDDLTWANSTLLDGDAGGAIAALKAEEGDDLFVIGSSDLLQTLIRHDLVDTFIVWTFPVVVGEGKRLFGEGAFPAGFRLADVQTSTTGVIIATYERAGAIKAGSFALEE